MPLHSQDYAALSEDAYKDRAVGRRDPGQEEQVILNGHVYRVLEHADNRRNGYQGTIYQRLDTREIVVSHRGTEQALLDGVLTDGGMVLARSNLQANDALALTGRALAIAQREGATYAQTPEVTVTGHSLGGALAQISAHHFNLKGETFNAYGAASLGYRIAEGGNGVINHAMAADPVSAASPHYGQVRLYATEDEIHTLRTSGFSNSRLNLLIPDSALVAAARSLDSHTLGNFIGEGSVLDNPQTQTLARDNHRMIDEYRDKLELLRGGLTLFSRGIPGGAVDLYDRLRGPLEPGEPARREAEKREAEHGTPRIDQPGHPANPLFNDAQRGVHALDAQVGRTPDHTSDQLAASLAVQMHAVGGKRIDQVVMSDDARHIFAVQGTSTDPVQLRASVETVPALNTPLEQSSRQADAQVAQQAEQDRQQEQALRSGRAVGG